MKIKIIKDAEQYAKELLKPAPKKFKRRSVKTFGVNDLFGSDICDMSNIAKFNDNVKYFLILMDLHSRYVWIFPMKTKTSNIVLNNFKKLKDQVGNFQNLWTDRGGEYVNKSFIKWCQENNINLYHTGGENKSVFVERFIRTLRGMISTYLIENNTERYIDKLNEIVFNYNNKKHRMIKNTPSNVYNGDRSVEVYDKPISNIKQKFKVNDYVRISRIKRTFEKGFTPNWSEEVFKIIAVDKNDDPVMYQFEDLLGERIAGKFYEPELQKTKLKDYAIIEKIIKSKKLNGKKMYYVKYRGYDNRFNEWINEHQMV